jgi:hypothetical protein
MQTSLRIALCFLLTLGMLNLTTPSWSQEVTAAIVGTVVDPSGAPIRGATVTTTDAERGTVWTAQTNDAGAYSFPRLPIGTYGVTVSSAGFDTATGCRSPRATTSS